MKPRSRGPGRRFLFWRTDFVGVAMIACGALFLLVNFRLLPASEVVVPRVLGVLFAMAGLLFLFFSGAGRWLTWFVIPAGALLTLGIVTVIFGWHRFVSAEAAGLLALGMGLTFLALFFFRPGHWWPLLPSGVFLGVGAWAWLGPRLPFMGWHPVAPLFFLGLSFLAIWLRSVQRRRMRWSLVTGAVVAGAAVLYLLGLLLARWSVLWPVVLLLAGVAIPVALWVADRRRGPRA